MSNRAAEEGAAIRVREDVERRELALLDALNGSRASFCAKSAVATSSFVSSLDFPQDMGRKRITTLDDYNRYGGRLGGNGFIHLTNDLNRFAVVDSFEIEVPREEYQPDESDPTASS